jgi:hypothetical protein
MSEKPTNTPSPAEESRAATPDVLTRPEKDEVYRIAWRYTESDRLAENLTGDIAKLLANRAAPPRAAMDAPTKPGQFADLLADLASCFADDRNPAMSERTRTMIQEAYVTIIGYEVVLRQRESLTRERDALRAAGDELYDLLLHPGPIEEALAAWAALREAAGMQVTRGRT